MRTAWLAGVLGAGVILAGCGSGEPAAQRPIPPAIPLPETSPAEAAPEEDTSLAAEAVPEEDTSSPVEPTSAPRAAFSRADRSSFRRLERSSAASLGLAVSAIGPGQPVFGVGTAEGGVAWSTAKVPVAMAALEQGSVGAGAAPLRAAITASDNAAAEQLWRLLGTPTDAAAATQSILRSGGDGRTAVPSERLRPAFTTFGQTAWNLRDQVRFAATMKCSAAGRSTLALMEQVVAGQRWGLGDLAGAAFKGGWGPGSRPGAAGGYLDRQFGVVRLDGRTVAVAIAASPADGTHDSGIRALNAVVGWLVDEVDIGALTAGAPCT